MQIVVKCPTKCAVMAADCFYCETKQNREHKEYFKNVYCVCKENQSDSRGKTASCDGNCFSLFVCFIFLVV